MNRFPPLKEILLSPCCNHPERASISICMMCGSPLCPECRTKDEGKNICPSCLRKIHEKAPYSHLIVYKEWHPLRLLLFSILSLALMELLGVTLILSKHRASLREMMEQNRRRMEIVQFALQDFLRDVGRYPYRDEGLKALLFKDPIGEGEIDGWKGPYIEKRLFSERDGSFLDVWGRAIIYEKCGERSFIVSLGYDGRLEASLDCADLCSRGGDDMLILINSK
jgi:hypothetical protein